MSQEAKAKVSLRVIVVGFKGIGGVAAALMLARSGHHVVLLEDAPQLSEVGAGIQVSPNMLKLLSRIGLRSSIERACVTLQHLQVLRWQDGALLQDHVAPSHPSNAASVPKAIHRADLHNILLDAALAMDNVELRLESTVAGYDFEKAVVRLRSGEEVGGDVVVAADGIKSLARRQMLQTLSGTNDADAAADEGATPTGDATYRLLIPRSAMVDDPELAALIDSSTGVRWVGPGRHVMGYPIRNHEMYNVVLIHPDRGDRDEAWTTRGRREDMGRDYEGWEGRVRKLIEMAPAEEILEWKLCMHRPLPTWVVGRCCLMGDACHPMLPYVAQGAAQAIEDAACLTTILSLIPTPAQLPLALAAYQASRKTRAEIVQSFGLANRDVLHMPDGERQRERDEAYARTARGGASPDKWLDANTQQFLWEWDAEEAGRCAWLMASVRAVL